MSGESTEIVVQAEPVAQELAPRPAAPQAPLAAMRHGIAVRNLDDVRFLASVAARAGLRGAGGKAASPDKAAIVIMRAVTMGLDPMAALLSWTWIGDKPCPPADDFMAACKMRPDLCQYFRLVESTDERATWETWRVGEPEPTRLTFTMEDAKRAGLTGNATYQKFPKQMLKKRAGAFLARDVYPELFSQTHSREEMEGVEADEPRRATVSLTAGPAAGPDVLSAGDRELLSQLAALGMSDAPGDLAAQAAALKAVAAKVARLGLAQQDPRRLALLRGYTAASDRLATMAARAEQDADALTAQQSPEEAA